jgi:hypothetical protein
MEPLLFISDPQPEQSSKINNIEHIIPLVNKPKLAYTYIEWKQLPTWTKTVVMMKYRKCTFTTLLMTPWTGEHKEDSKACSYRNVLLIYKNGWHDMDEINLSVVHIIYNQCSILPNKENEIPFWVNCNHSILLITKLRTNFNIHTSK